MAKQKLEKDCVVLVNGNGSLGECINGCEGEFLGLSNHHDDGWRQVRVGQGVYMVHSCQLKFLRAAKKAKDPVKYRVTRNVSPKECPWLKEFIKKGTIVHKFSGQACECVSRAEVAVSLTEHGPVFKLPLDALWPSKRQK